MSITTARRTKGAAAADGLRAECSREPTASSGDDDGAPAAGRRVCAQDVVVDDDEDADNGAMNDANAADRVISNDRAFYAFNAVVSVVALGFLFWLLVLRTADAGGGHVDLRFLPAVNASFNALSATLLTIGFFFIRQKKPNLHKYCMVGAFASSGLFLVSYVIYHYVHGDTKFTGEGPIRAVYLLILLTHVLLSMLIVPGALGAFWFAGTRRFTTHKKITRVLLPAWLYVSVTGVVIFFLLRAYGQTAA